MSEELIIVCTTSAENLEFAAANICQWPDEYLPYSILSLVPGFTLEEMRAAVEWAFGTQTGWGAIANVKTVWEETAAKARLLIEGRVLDGPGRVLADCQLPCSRGQRQVLMRIDTSENYIMSLVPGVRGIVLPEVLCHEGGHAQGLGHAPQGSANRMAPRYREGQGFGDWDKAEIWLRRGKAIPRPTPSPDPVPRPTPVPIPTPGGSFMGKLMKFLLRQALAAFEAYAARTEDKLDDAIAAFLRQMLDSLDRGETAKVEAALTAARQQLTV